LDVDSQAEQFLGFPTEHGSCKNHEFLLLKIIRSFYKITVINVTGESETRWHFLLHSAKQKVGVSCIPKLPAITSILPSEGKILQTNATHCDVCAHARMAEALW